MAQPSHLSRSQLAVLAVTGVAAAYGIYVLYDAFSDRDVKPSLQRSNAIRSRHASPRSRSAVVIASFFLLPDDNAPLGRLVLRYDDESTKIFNLAQEGVPAIDEAAIRPRIIRTVVECVLTATQHATTEHQRQFLADNVLLSLTEAVSNHDPLLVLRLAGSVYHVLSPHVTLNQVEDAISSLSPEISSGDFERDHGSDLGSHDVTFADTEDVDGLRGGAEPSQGFKGLLYHIAETDAKRKAYEHRGIFCEECGERPIRGVRWHCLNCPNFDLCSTCEATTEHHKTHVFVKIKVPLPVLSQPTKEFPLWYPGDPRRYHASLNPQLRKDLGADYGFSEPQMDAHYDQFVCIANVPWHEDPTGIKAAIDRRAFNKALTSEQWPRRFRPNALYDRMFTFYDTNHDGFIGFEEFISGLAYLRGPKRFDPLDRALEGFDIDGDGKVDRTDFLRLFRAKYEIQKLLVNDLIQWRGNEQTNNAMETLRSSQPISSIFVGEDIPRGEDRPRTGKVMNPFGDFVPVDGTKAILSDDEGWPERRSRESQQNGINGDATESSEDIQTRLHRLAEVLHHLEEDSNIDSMRSGEGHPNSDQQQHETNKRSEDSSTEPQAIHTDENDDLLEAINEAMLRQIIEDGLHEMLDPLFKAKEAQDRMVIATREERLKWRKEIDALEDSNVSNGLKLIETHDTLSDDSKLARGLVNGLVPTDSSSLARSEEAISGSTLQELLDASGYSVNGSGGSDTNNSIISGPPPPSVNQSPVQSMRIELAQQREEPVARPEQRTEAAFDPSIQDPTMPQNRPNSSVPIASTLEEDGIGSVPGVFTNEWEVAAGLQGAWAVIDGSPESPPSTARLQELRYHDRLDAVISVRGGPGKLTFREIEDLVKSDPTKELKGLVTNWLEWASF